MRKGKYTSLYQIDPVVNSADDLKTHTKAP